MVVLFTHLPPLWYIHAKVIQSIAWESLHRTDNKLLIDISLALSYPVNLAYRYTHRFSQLGQVPVTPVTKVKNLRLTIKSSTIIIPLIMTLSINIA